MHGNKIVKIFKTTNVTMWTKAILKSFLENNKTTRPFLRVVEFWPTFNIQIAITLAIFWEKLQNCTF